MPGYQDAPGEGGPGEGGLPSFGELTSPERELDPGELRQDLIHQMGLADRRPARRREDLPDTAGLREQMGI